MLTRDFIRTTWDIKLTLTVNRLEIVICFIRTIWDIKMDVMYFTQGDGGILSEQCGR